MAQKDEEDPEKREEQENMERFQSILYPAELAYGALPRTPPTA